MMVTSFKTIPKISTITVAKKNAQMTTVILLVSEVNTICRITSDLVHVELSEVRNNIVSKKKRDHL
jgi:hypothetical protein